MAFCTHCGAQLPDGVKFCTSCGTPVAASNVSARPSADGRGIVIDAPAGSTVSFSQSTHASETKGEEEMSAWGEFVPDGQEQQRPAAPSRPAPKPYEQAYQQAFPQQQPYQQAPPPPPSYQQPAYQQPAYQQPVQEPQKPKKKLTFGRILYLALLIIIGLYLLSQLITIFAS